MHSTPTIHYTTTIHSFRINAIDYHTDTTSPHFHEKHPSLALKAFSCVDLHENGTIAPMQQHLLTTTQPTQFIYQTGYYSYTWNKIVEFSEIGRARGSNVPSLQKTMLLLELYSVGAHDMQLLGHAEVHLEDSLASKETPQHKRIPIPISEGKLFGILSLTVTAELREDKVGAQEMRRDTLREEHRNEGGVRSVSSARSHMGTQSDEIIIAQHHNLQEFQTTFSNEGSLDGDSVGERSRSSSIQSNHTHDASSMRNYYSPSNHNDEHKPPSFYSDKPNPFAENDDRPAARDAGTSTEIHQHRRALQITTTPSTSRSTDSLLTAHRESLAVRQLQEQHTQELHEKDLLIQKLEQELETKCQMEEKLKAIKDKQQDIISEFQKRHTDMQHQLTIERARSDQLQRKQIQSTTGDNAQKQMLLQKLTIIRTTIQQLRSEKSMMLQDVDDYRQHLHQHVKQITHHLGSFEKVNKNQLTDVQQTMERTIQEYHTHIQQSAEKLQQMEQFSYEKSHQLQETRAKLITSEEEVQKLQQLLMHHKAESQKREDALSQIEERMDAIIDQTKADNIAFMKEMQAKEQNLRKREAQVHESLEALKQKELQLQDLARTLEEERKQVNEVQQHAVSPQIASTESTTITTADGDSDDIDTTRRLLQQKESDLNIKEKLLAERQAEIEGTIEALKVQQKEFEAQHQQLAAVLNEKMEEVESYSTNLEEKEQILDEQFEILKEKLQEVHQKELALASATNNSEVQAASLQQMMKFSEKLEAFQQHLNLKEESLNTEETRLKEMENKVMEMAEKVRSEYQLLEERVQAIKEKETEFTQSVTQKEETLKEHLEQYNETREKILKQAEDLQARETKFLADQQGLLEERNIIRQELEAQLSNMELREKALLEKEHELEAMTRYIEENRGAETSEAEAQTDVEGVIVQSNADYEFQMEQVRLTAHQEYARTIEVLEEEMLETTSRFSSMLQNKEKIVEQLTQELKEMRTELAKVKAERQQASFIVHTQQKPQLQQSNVAHYEPSIDESTGAVLNDAPDKIAEMHIDDLLFAPASVDSEADVEEQVDLSYLSNSRVQDGDAELAGEQQSNHTSSQQSASHDESSFHPDSIDNLVTKTQVLKMRVEDHYQQYPSEQESGAAHELHLIMQSLEELSHEFSEQKDQILEERSRLLQRLEEQQSEGLSRILQFADAAVNSAVADRHTLNTESTRIAKDSSVVHSKAPRSDQSFDTHLQHHQPDIISDYDDSSSEQSHIAAAPRQRQTPPRLSRLLQEHSDIISPLILSRKFADDDDHDLGPNIESPTKHSRYSFPDARAPLPRNDRRPSLRHVGSGLTEDALKRTASLSKQRMLDRTRKTYLKKRLQLDLLASPPPKKAME